MGYQQSIKVIAEPADLFPKVIDFTAREHAIRLQLLNATRGPLTWADPTDKIAYSFWTELMIKPLKDLTLQIWKRRYYALQYGMGPRRLSKNLNLGGIASGSTLDGAPPKEKQNGTQS